MSGSNPGNLPQIPGTSDTRPASLDRSGMMRRWVVPTATIGGFVTTGTGSQQRVGVAPATASVAGVLTAADFAKLAGLQVPVNRVTYVPAGDPMPGTALAAGIWLDVHANLSFTVGSATAWLLVELKCAINVTAAAVAQLGARVLVNSGGTPVAVGTAGCIILAGGYGALGSCAFTVAPGILPVGTNTLKTQVYSSVAATAYCRPLTQPNTEPFSLRVLEVSA